ncbi:MAG TPA: tetratricopeptide repeat protein, partial [Acidobacteriota bacterium]|nr:tetratricopeptide repeat protein [Acidobacteriota bacterium]
DDARGVTRVIPGHRDIWPKEKLAFWRDYIVELWSGVQAAFKQGISIDEALTRFPLDARFDYLKDLGHTEEELGQFQERNVRAFWRQVAESAVERLEALIQEKGLEKALAQFNDYIRRENRFLIDEREFNALGYRLMNAGSIEAAIAVFTVNTEEFPGSWNAWDSLGEAYMINGDREKAIENYNRSLSLNPENENAKAMLERLEEGKQ